MTSRKRREDESYKDYRLALKLEEEWYTQRLKGVMVYKNKEHINPTTGKYIPYKEKT